MAAFEFDDKENARVKSSAKPVVFSDDRTPVEKFDPRVHQGAVDPGRISGYAETVQANDIAKADDLIFRNQNLGKTKEDLYKQIGARPAELPVEFKWLRISGPGGGESPNAHRELDGYRNKEGFGLATQDDLDRYGYGFPEDARKAEDGTIRRGPDVALYVRDGEVARMWDKFRDEQTALMEGDQLSGTLRAGDYSVETYSEELERDTITYAH